METAREWKNKQIEPIESFRDTATHAADDAVVFNHTA